MNICLPFSGSSQFDYGADCSLMAVLIELHIAAIDKLVAFGPRTKWICTDATCVQRGGAARSYRAALIELASSHFGENTQARVCQTELISPHAFQ